MAASLTASENQFQVTGLLQDRHQDSFAAEYILLPQLWRIVYKFPIDEHTRESVKVARYLHRNRAKCKNHSTHDSTCVDWLFAISSWSRNKAQI